MQVMLLSMMEKLSELRSKFEGEAFKLFIGGSTAGNACSMQGNINENKLYIPIAAHYVTF